MPPDTARYCQIPPDTARYYQIRRDTARYRQIPPGTAKCHQILPVSARYSQIPPDTARYPYTARYHKIPPDATKIPADTTRCHQTPPDTTSYHQTPPITTCQTLQTSSLRHGGYPDHLVVVFACRCVWVPCKRRPRVIGVGARGPRSVCFSGAASRTQPCFSCGTWTLDDCSHPSMGERMRARLVGAAIQNQVKILF